LRGDVPGTFHAECLRLKTPGINTFAERGCVFWVRATGGDDDADTAKGWKVGMK
jgi:hypothetical protein